ncbi:MAG: isoamylase early set domain-containing protein [Candidatus Wallbacteria bacterium]|nr:isoamylase early set domain-containing protein [Candidatus Wallbacteria bacterium]
MWRFLTWTGTFIAGFFLGYKLAFRDEKDTVETGTRCVVFQFEAPEAGNVSIAGDFNSWDPKSDELFHLGGGKWGITLYLKPGRYQYKFVVDDQTWTADPASAETEDDGYGGRRSIIYVG